MPSFFILYISVVRFKPSLSAAPFGPPILQSVASSAWSMCARSESRSVICTESGPRGGSSVAGEGVMDPTAVGSGFGSTPSRARITARSTRFCSSRMFPGQECNEKAVRVSGGTWWMGLLMRRLKMPTKCSTRAGISPSMQCSLVASTAVAIYYSSFCHRSQYICFLSL
jgi:hypothetical protein